MQIFYIEKLFELIKKEIKEVIWYEQCWNGRTNDQNVAMLVGNTVEIWNNKTVENNWGKLFDNIV